MSIIELEKAIHIRQPVYLPGIVYFDQLLQADTHVVYDNVQYERRHWGNRNKITNLTRPEGWQWLTVPIVQKGKRGQLYTETQIDNSHPWAREHWMTILYNYKKSPFFKSYADYWEGLYKKEWKNLIDLNLAITRFMMTQLNISTQIVLASSLKTRTEFDNKNERLVQIVKELNGTTYITVMGTKDYIDPQKFKDANITLLWHKFNHPVYTQFQGRFVPWMSAIDLLFNHGKNSGEILKANTQNPIP